MAEIAKRYGVTIKDVEQIVKSQYEFIRSVITNLNLPRDLSEEDFRERIKNFNIPSIGKLYGSYNVYKKINKLDEEKSTNK